MNSAHAELEVQFPNQLRHCQTLLRAAHRKPAPLRGANAKKVIDLVREAGAQRKGAPTQAFCEFISALQ